MSLPTSERQSVSSEETPIRQTLSAAVHLMKTAECGYFDPAAHTNIIES